jgi:hypothetical protein
MCRRCSNIYRNELMKTQNVNVFIALCLASIGASLLEARSNGPPAALKWGPNVQGIQLATYMTNNIMLRGSTVVVATVFTNSSANTIHLFMPPDYAARLYLTNASGSYALLSPFSVDSTWDVPLYSQQEKTNLIPFNLGTNVPPGDYTLTADYGFRLSDDNFVVKAVPIEVKVK